MVNIFNTTFTPSGYNLVVGGLWWAVELNMLGSIPIRSFPGLPNTRFWWVGSCIRGLLPKGGSKGHCLGEVARHIKKTYSVKLLFWYLKARCIFFPKIKFLGADTFLMEKLRILHSLSSFFIFWTGSAELKVCIWEEPLQSSMPSTYVDLFYAFVQNHFFCCSTCSRLSFLVLRSAGKCPHEYWSKEEVWVLGIYKCNYGRSSEIF